MLLRWRLIVIMLLLSFWGAVTHSPMLFAADEKEKITFVPSVDYKSFLIKQAVKTADKRDRVINILNDLLKIYPEGEERAQLKLRLAHLYLDKARHLYFFELYKNDPEAEKLIKGEMSTTRQSLNKLKLESSYSFNREAIKIYREVLDGYPKLPNRDEVYFYLAYNLGEVGENKQAQNYYNALINTYPNSKYVPEAYLVQAEYYFYDDKFQPALDTYKKVLKYKGSEVYDLAVYKIAWCYFNLSNISLALKTMEQIAEGEQKTATELDLREEALRDIVVIFAYGGYHKEAPFYFKQIGGAENYRPMIKRLAGIYFAQGKNGYADELYKRLINEDPGDKENPEFQRRLVDIAKRLGRKEDVIIEASKLVRFYSDESKWSAKNKNDWNALQQAHDLSESTLREIALSMHNEAQKTKDDRTYQLSNASYREYLDNFPDTKDANKIRFYYAESLFKLGKLEQAAIEYTKVLNTDPKGQYALQAAYGAIVSYDEVINAHAGEVAKEAKPSKKPTFVPLWERESVKVSDNFVRNFPQDRRAPQIAFKAAKVFYDRNHFKEAIKRFDQVITDYPGASTTTFAVNLVLDSWNIQEKWDEVVSWGKKYYANPAMPPGKFKLDLYALIEKASFKVCRSLEDGGKYQEAAEAYLKFTDEFKQSDFLDDAFNNAAVSYRKAKQVREAIGVYQRLIKVAPNSPFVQNATLSIGKSYEDLAMFSEAANYYEIYQQRYVDAKNSADLIYNAAVLRENLGDYDKAIRDYNLYVTKYRSEKDIALTEFAIPLLMEKQKRWQEAATTYAQLANRYRSQPDFYITALGKGADMVHKGGDANRAQGLYRQAVNAYVTHVNAKRSQLGVETIELAAKAHFKLVEPIFVEYARVKLDVGLASFTPNLQRKIKLLDQLVKEYQKVVNYGSSLWVATSIYRMALAYDDFAANLRKVREPAGLSAPEQQAFMKQIGDIGQNMKTRAIEAYGACLERAAELDVFDPIIIKAEKRLADLSAKSKTEVKEFVHEPIYVDDIVGKGELL